MGIWLSLIHIYLKKQGVDLNVNLDALQTEYDGLKATHTELAGQLATDVYKRQG